MVKASEIRDEASLRAWLEGRPPPDAMVIAQRAVLRAAPVEWSWATIRGEDIKLTTLPLLATCLTAGVAARLKYPEQDAQLPVPALREAAMCIRDSVGASQKVEFPEFASFLSLAANITAAAAYEAADAGPQFDYATEQARLASVSAVAGAIDYSEESHWNEVRTDVHTLSAGNDLATLPLWHARPTRRISKREAEFRKLWETVEPDVWGFWLRWWDGVVSGKQIKWALQERVALIAHDIWEQGAEAVAAEIARIESQVTPQATDSTLAQDINALPAPVGETVAKVKAAMERHREALPPTFDAIEGLILLELDRMKGKNDFGDLGHAEFQRRRKVLLLLYEAVKTLRAQLPSSGPVSTAQAERSERALRLIFKKLADLPVKKADEIADNLWGVGERIVQAGLIAGTTALATAYGCPMPLALTAGTFVFAPSKAADIIRTTKEALLGSK